MIKTKQELLNHFSNINEMYNNPFMYQTLSNMIDELLEQQPCEDCKVKKEAYIQGYDYGVKDWFKSKSQPCEDAISREAVLDLATTIETDDYSGNETLEVVEVKEIKELPSVTPSYNSIKPELKPCEDCISRLIVQEEITKSIALKENPHQMYKRIQAIPSVTPKAESEKESEEK